MRLTAHHLPLYCKRWPSPGFPFQRYLKAVLHQSLPYLFYPTPMHPYPFRYLAVDHPFIGEQ
jgi:hypothetical protein